eukprot:TRINITY_DN771_c0_g1_i11.p2 TRINITY_DN771_c0_g1~~TRINITY_DN771_c0_g1_i11.p2  ORF type:complete len:335 (+),score=141.60 TRINITY_DN771_c0_g1_i11:605-1609(+)
MVSRMVSGVVALVCLATLGSGAGAEKKEGFQRIPAFYKSGDCSGELDSSSMLWGTSAVHGGVVRPFSTAGAYLPVWAMYKCLTDSTLSYAVRLVVNETACADGEAENQLQLQYFAGDKTCSTEPVVTPLTAGACVGYPLGSVNVSSEIPLEDLCVVSDYVARLQDGSMRVDTWANEDCYGVPVVSQVTNNQKQCANQPECVGCCQTYDPTTCDPNAGMYAMQKNACTKNGATWRYALRGGVYSSAMCTKEVNSALSGRLIENDKCVMVEAEGVKVSVKMSFTKQLTVEARCKLNEVALRNDVDPSIVTWDELNAAGVAVPQVLTVAALLVAALL